ncbi:MAG: dihydroxyacetone kinase [Clostridiales bacterium]|jgi:DAK2 domain fusion protein YloV|nr:MAG: dihydroxyacetone kinase [Clostridiales bacterium]
MKRLTSQKYYAMLLHAAQLLEAHSETINNMNVFPVPDGDTGSNMTMTIQGVFQVPFTPEMPLGDCAAKAAEAMLRSARGNSGVILSVFFRGVGRALKGKTAATAADLAAGFAVGAESAYGAVMNPTEGTILTVMRAAADCAKQVAKLDPESDLEAFFAAVLTAADGALQKTPDLLPKLKEAGVVDAGGCGFLDILSAMDEALNRAEDVLEVQHGTPAPSAAPAPSGSAAARDAAEIVYPYCTECIIEKSAPYQGEGGAKPLHQFVEQAGDSAVFVDDDSLVKIHVHTADPGRVLTEALRYGSLLTVKVENMRQQHSELLEQPAPAEPAPVREKSKENAFVAVANGEGICAVLRDLGVDELVTGGQTMNPSTEDLLSAIRRADSKVVFVLPNNGNIVMAAQQAAALAAEEDIRAIVLPTHSIQQGVTALYAFQPHALPEENQEAMTEALKTVHSMAVTYAVRDSEYDGKAIRKGQILGLTENKVTVVTDSKEDCVRALLGQVTGAGCVTVFYGSDVSEEEAQAMERQMAQQLGTGTDLVMVSGGQPVYTYLIAME